MITIFKVFFVDIFSKFISMITTILLIREMNEYFYANYIFLVTITNIFSQIVISSFGKLYIVDYKNFKNLENTLLLLEIFLSIQIILLFYYFQPSIKNSLLELFLLMISTAIFNFIRILYQQQCKFSIFSLLEIIRVFLFFILTLIFKFKLTTSNVIYFQIISLLSSILFIFYKKNRVNLINKINLKKVLKLLLKKEQMYLFVYAILMAILLQLDILLLKKYTTNYSLAVYSSAIKYYNILLMFLSTVNNVLLPKITLETSYLKIKKIYKQQDIFSIIVLIGAIIAIILSPKILPLLNKGKYPEAIPVFRILCISAVISFLSSPYNNLLIKEKKYFGICLRFIIGIIISIFGNMILIPIYGVKGTAFMTLISYGFVNFSARIEARIILEKKIKEEIYEK